MNFGDKGPPLPVAAHTSTGVPAKSRSSSEPPPSANVQPSDHKNPMVKGPGGNHTPLKRELHSKVNIEDASSFDRPLPPNFQPSERTVLIGKGASISQHSGNQHLRFLAAQALQGYTHCSDRREKIEIVNQLLATTKAASPAGAFVKQVGVNRWVEVTDKAAREKIGYTLRDLAPDRYLSSTQSKLASRRRTQFSSDHGNHVEAKVRRRVASSPRDTNIKIPAESMPTRPLSPFPSTNSPEAPPIVDGVMVATPLQEPLTNRQTHSDATSGFARRMTQWSPPPSIREHPPSPFRERHATRDARNQQFERKRPISAQDRLGHSVFALPQGFSALPPHITVAEAFLSQETSDRWSHQQSGQGAPVFAPYNAANAGVAPQLPDQKGADNAAIPDNEWALAFGSSPEGSEEDNKNSPV